LVAELRARLLRPRLGISPWSTKTTGQLSRRAVHERADNGAVDGSRRARRSTFRVADLGAERSIAPRSRGGRGPGARCARRRSEKLLEQSLPRGVFFFTALGWKCTELEPRAGSSIAAIRRGRGRGRGPRSRGDRVTRVIVAHQKTTCPRPSNRNRRQRRESSANSAITVRPTSRRAHVPSPDPTDAEQGHRARDLGSSTWESGSWIRGGTAREHDAERGGAGESVDRRVVAGGSTRRRGRARSRRATAGRTRAKSRTIRGRSDAVRLRPASTVRARLTHRPFRVRHTRC